MNVNPLSPIYIFFLMTSASVLSALPRSLHAPCLWESLFFIQQPLRAWFRMWILVLPIFIAEVFICVCVNSSVRLEVCHPVEAAVFSILTRFTRKVLLLLLKFSHYLKNIWCFNKYIYISQTPQHLSCHYTGVIQYGENTGGCSSFSQITQGAGEQLHSIVAYLLHLSQIHLCYQVFCWEVTVIK